MAEIKWIKLSIGMFDDEKIKIIEDMPEADTIIVIWLKLMTMTGRSNMGGYIMLTESIPYTEDMLISVIKRPLPVIKMALSIFERFGMLEISEQGAFFLPNWEKHQNTESLEKVREYERKRKAEQRAKRKILQLGEASPGNVPDSPGNVTPLEVRSKTKEKEDSCCLTPEAEINSKDEGIPSSRQGTVPATSETDTVSEQNEISSSDIDYRQAVADKYLRRRGKGLEITIADDQTIDELIKEGVPLQTVLDGIDQAFDNFKPKHRRDEIRSVSYCATVIYSLHASRQTANQNAVTVESEQGSDSVLRSDEQYNTDNLQKMLAELRAKQGG
ncbi:phage replisome organizer N-terminal domain-containing protein [Paenibacillus polymyxa]|uniref:phage replisome organizer N-terminal domain-containing protein n=1 Tax=Paenibacillus polymyxa TaxID=1406 RepID=UPI002222E81D|nr:phage replisome organizer N-terminal domain-containing protein [Paenibacillus polymyxa]